MPRLLYTLAAVGLTGGVVAGLAPQATVSSAVKTQVVGEQRPLFLGSAVVRASALPEAR